MPKGEAKGRIVPVRFTHDDLKEMTMAAKLTDQTVSHWIRSTIHNALQKLREANEDQGSRSKESRQIRKELRSLGHRGGLRGA